MRVPPPLTWQQWKINHQYELQHIAGYEEAFVDNILSQLYEVSPNDVIPQYHFIDVRGNNRYIDFMIINENKGWLLPIELDGFAKLHDYGSSYDHFQDMLYRQNEIIMRFGSILRFTNKDMYQDKKRTLAQISKKLKEQAKVYEQKSLVKVETRVIEKIVEKPVEVVKYIESSEPKPRFVYQDLQIPAPFTFWRNWCKHYDLDKDDFFIQEFLQRLTYNKPSMFAIKHADNECIILRYAPTNDIVALLIFCDELKENIPIDTVDFWLKFNEDEVYNNTNKVIKAINTKVEETYRKKHKSFMDMMLYPFKLLGKLFGLIDTGLTSLEHAIDETQDKVSREYIQVYKTRINKEKDYTKRKELKQQLEDYRKIRNLSKEYVDSIEPKLILHKEDLKELEEILKEYDIK